MRFKIEEEFIITEANLSRIYNHIQDPNTTFAVIGTRDKDTGAEQWMKFRDKMLNLDKRLGKSFGYNIFKGVYTYKDGRTEDEYSAIILNIPKEEALKIAKELNQESIIWKDNNFFGFIDVDSGKEDNSFTDKTMSFDDSLTKQFGSRLLRKNKPFIFK